MKTSSISILTSLSSLLLSTNAWPLLPNVLERRKPASYSVVAVDGGSTEGSVASATTVTDAVTHTETLMTTQLSTLMVTESDTPATIVLTVTTAAPTTITDYMPGSVTTEISYCRRTGAHDDNIIIVNNHNRNDVNDIGYDIIDYDRNDINSNVIYDRNDDNYERYHDYTCSSSSTTSDLGWNICYNTAHQQHDNDNSDREFHFHF
ncbi:hypothetical protein A1O1_02081 [Capronia coronata CBS 617.96]|uniref:Uncharacterized protein n=1 Tax=Capronia coronata CBS 617.96 TaxID=1182541 RepID=W9ZGQ0_9EURO|nr:uncharacterized protein A1O1_02081 [Capronia coronata CBS 617.96]EXJ93689.1 hypothetical protein A1O1_02081 [Capronia coronata CBS 617.96]